MLSLSDVKLFFWGNNNGQTLVINPWCKIYILILVLFQGYFFQWDLFVGLKPFLFITIFGGLFVIITKGKDRRGEAGRLICIISIILQLPILLFFSFISIYWDNVLSEELSISFELVLVIGTLFLFAFGIALYSRIFWINPNEYTYPKEKRVFFIFLVCVFLGCFYFKGGPDIKKALIPSNTHAYMKRQIVDLYSWNPAKRDQAAKQLGYFPAFSAPAIPFLVSMLGDHVRYSGGRNTNYHHSPGKTASMTLNAIGKPATSLLIKSLENKNRIVRINTMNALNGANDRDAQNALLTCLTDEDDLVRKLAVRKMEWYTKSRDPRIAIGLISALLDTSSTVRIAAAWNLNQFEDPRMIEPLIRSLSDDNEDFRRSVLAILKGRTRKDFGPDQNVWKNWWKTNEKKFIEKHFIKKPGSFHRIIPYSLSHLKDPFDISQLTEALTDQNINVRKSAIWMLGESGSPLAVEPLITAMNNNKQVLIQKLIASTLFQITAVNIGKDLEKWERWWAYNKYGFFADKNSHIRKHPRYLKASLLSDTDNAFYVALKLGEPAVIPMINALINGDAHIKKKAAAKLGFMKDPRAIKPLIDALYKEKGVKQSYAIRESAVLSLMGLTGQEIGRNPDEWQKWWDHSNFALFLKDSISTVYGSQL